MSFGKLQSQGQNFVSRLGGATILTPQQQAQLTPEQLQLYNQQKEMARSAGMKELSARLSDAFAGRDVAGRALEREKLRQVKDTRTAFQKNLDYLMSRGFSFEEANKILKQGTTIQMPGQESEFLKEAAKAGFATKKQIDQEVKDNESLLSRVKMSKDQLLAGVKTGVVEEFLKPFRNLAIGLGVADQETINNYTQQELFEATTNYLVPRMRVSGSGSTSDLEIDLFRSAVPNLGRTTQGNLVVAAGLENLFEYNKKRAKLADEYLKQERSLLGFGEYADDKLGNLYESYSSDNEFDKKVKDGVLKEGQFVFDGINNQFRVLTKEDIEGAL